MKQMGRNIYKHELQTVPGDVYSRRVHERLVCGTHPYNHHIVLTQLNRVSQSLRPVGTMSHCGSVEPFSVTEVTFGPHLQDFFRIMETDAAYLEFNQNLNYDDNTQLAVIFEIISNGSSVYKIKIIVNTVITKF